MGGQKRKNKRGFRSVSLTLEEEVSPDIFGLGKKGYRSVFWTCTTRLKGGWKDTFLDGISLIDRINKLVSNILGWGLRSLTERGVGLPSLRTCLSGSS